MKRIAPFALAASLMFASVATAQTNSDQETRNKAVVERYYAEIINRGDYARAPELIADDLKQNSTGVAQGRDGVVGEMSQVRTVLGPDFRIDIEQIVADGDIVVVRAVVSGTHVGPLYGVAPTNRRVRFASMDFFRVRDGKLAEHWDVTDRLDLMTQIGAVAPVTSVGARR